MLRHGRRSPSRLRDRHVRARTHGAIVLLALALSAAMACGTPGTSDVLERDDPTDTGAFDAAGFDAPVGETFDGSVSPDGFVLSDSSTSPDVAPAIDAPTDGSAPDVLDAGPPGVRIIGRTDRSSAAGPRFAWPGTSIVARFRGRSATLRLADRANYYEVFVDGAARPTLVTNATQQDYVLATGLADAVHDVVVYRRTEANQGETQFLGLAMAPGGVLLPAPAPAARRIEVIGDSITCGYGNEGTSATCNFSGATENHYLTYGALASRALGAEVVSTSISGIGMYRNYGGSMTSTMPQLYDRALPNRASPTWDFASWVPDVVVVNLGTNDFSTGDPGQPFVDAYVAFARRLRAHYPRAWIVCALGPLLADTWPAGAMRLTRARGHIQRVVATLQTAGDGRVSFFEFPPVTASEGYGCDYHPSLATHRRMGDQLAAELRRRLGW